MENKPKISIIAAIGQKNNALGNNGQLLFRISDDLKQFKNLTTGHPIIMGRKTFESIGKALPNRRNFVITRNPDFTAPDIIVFKTLEKAIEEASKIELTSTNETKEIFIIGGGEIYKQGLPFTDKLYLTLVESDAQGDVFFPDYSEFKKIIKKEDRTDEKTGLNYSWIDLEK